jgi:hypothetical protein
LLPLQQQQQQQLAAPFTAAAAAVPIASAAAAPPPQFQEGRNEIAPTASRMDMKDRATALSAFIHVLADWDPNLLAGEGGVYEKNRKQMRKDITTFATYLPHAKGKATATVTASAVHAHVLI